MFKQFYCAECKKATRLKAIVGLLVAAVLLCVVYLAVVGVVRSVASDEIEGQLPADFAVVRFSPEINRIGLENAREMLEEALRQKEEQGYSYYIGTNDPVYAAKSTVALYEYAVEHDLSGSYTVYMGNETLLMMIAPLSYPATVAGLLSVLMLFPMIYAVIVGVRSFASEFRDRTIKLVLLRPVRRETLALTKLLAVLTHAAAAFAATLLLALIAGTIPATTTSVADTIYVFNASDALVASDAFVLCPAILFGLLSVLVVAAVSYAFGLLLRKVSSAMLLSLLLVFDVTGIVLQLTGLSRFSFGTALSLSYFFGAGITVPQANFFLSAAILILWGVGLPLAAILLFRKRDVA